MSRTNRKPGTERFGPPARARAYSTTGALLEDARRMFVARQRVASMRRECDPDDGEPDRERVDSTRKALCQERTWTRVWHRSFGLTGRRLELCRRCRGLRLNRLERELLIGLILIQLGMVDEPDETTCRALLGLLCVKDERRLAAMGCLAETGRLAGSGLITYEDENDDPVARELLVDPLLLDAITAETGTAASVCLSERALRRLISGYAAVLRKKARELDWLLSGVGSAGDHHRLVRRAATLRRVLDAAIDGHPGTKLAGLLGRPLLARSARRRTVVLVLVAGSLGLLDEDDRLFSGRGLACAAAAGPADVPETLGLLGPRSALRRQCLIQLQGGKEEDTASIRQARFELSHKSLRLAGITKREAASRASCGARPAQVRREQLVLTERVDTVLDMALAQVRHRDTFLGAWGLGEAVPYGRAVTLLFCGAPGLGKTACAEALAAELGRPILAADYGRIQSKWAGQTEKNIARTFRDASRAGALLLFDEADAMFYDRDRATQAWEAREVNVLLGELERFDGVCVLATNRRPALDPALARRIAVEIRFEHPDRGMRRRIWDKLLPAGLPLADDVDLDALAARELTGGEIKNCVLNAARLALVRNPRGPVCRRDFDRALRLQRHTAGTRSIGFDPVHPRREASGTGSAGTGPRADHGARWSSRIGCTR